MCKHTYNKTALVTQLLCWIALQGWLKKIYFLSWFAFPSNSCMNTCECASFHLNHWTAHHNLLFSSLFSSFFCTTDTVYRQLFQTYEHYYSNIYYNCKAGNCLWNWSFYTHKISSFFPNQCVLRAFLKGESKRCIYLWVGIQLWKVKPWNWKVHLRKEPVFALGTAQSLLLLDLTQWEGA